MDKDKKTVACPDCDSSIQLAENPEVGDILVCDKCGVELELTNLEPPGVDYLLTEK